ncbi:MAG: TraB/GumN family protein [bacterium]|nr:TraB/GumN family protein [bacterium]
MIEELSLDGRRIILLGTAHISAQSIEDVRQAITEYQPDQVCVELCVHRYDAIKNAEHWQRMDIVRVIKEGKAPLLLANLMLTAFQKKMGDQLGVRPGAEMVAAIEAAEAIGAKVVLADRAVTTTLKRAWGALGFFEKLKALMHLIGGSLNSQEVSEAEIEELKNTDVLTEAIESMAAELPGIKTVLIDERDRYLAQKIRSAEGPTVLAVVGAGHLPGIQRQITEEHDLEPLRVIPKPSPWVNIIKFGMPLIIIAMIVYGFAQADAQVSWEMIKRWVLANGLLSGLGALIAGGHPLTVLTAFVAAPITSLNPTIAAGWVSGLTEAWLRKPTVQDFENLGQDITSLAGFRRNEITRILLVVILSNVGSALGTFLGIPLLASLL